MASLLKMRGGRRIVGPALELGVTREPPELVDDVGPDQVGIEGDPMPLQRLAIAGQEQDSRNSADPALPAGPRLRVPRRPGRRQRRARDVRRHPGRAAARPRRPGPDVRGGVHLPDGRAHHDRRPDPLPAQRRRGALEAQGPDRPRRGLPQAQRPRRRRLLRGRPGGGGRPRPPPARGVQGAAGPPAVEHVRPRVLRDDRRARRPARRLRGVPRVVRGEPA